MNPSVETVTPYMGVWIETSEKASLCSFFSSLPIWECGLKQSGKDL